MSVTGGNSVGIPLLLLHDAQGADITVELKDGCTYTGLLEECQDNMNCTMKNVTRTDVEGNTMQLAMAYLRGNMILFFCVPEMLKHAPFFNRIKVWRKHGGHFVMGGGDAWMRDKFNAGRQQGGGGFGGGGGYGGGGGGGYGGGGPARQSFGGHGFGGGQGPGPGPGQGGSRGGYGGPPPQRAPYGGGGPPPGAPGPGYSGVPSAHMQVQVPGPAPGYARGPLPGMGMVPMPRGPPPGPGGMMPRGFTGPPPGYGPPRG